MSTWKNVQRGIYQGKVMILCNLNSIRHVSTSGVEAIVSSILSKKRKKKKVHSLSMWFLYPPHYSYCLCTQPIFSKTLPNILVISKMKNSLWDGSGSCFTISHLLPFIVLIFTINAYSTCYITIVSRFSFLFLFFISLLVMNNVKYQITLNVNSL